MAARSVHVQFDVSAMPNTQLVLVGSGLSHGEWSAGSQPPESLTPPITSITWQSESDGFLTGTQGWVRYYPVTPGGSAPANPPDEDTIYITWDDPYVGSNSYSSTAPSPYRISGGSILGAGVGGDADNDMAVFTLSSAGELQTSNTSPALTFFAPGPEGSQLVLAYVATNNSNDLFVTTTDALGTWSQSNPVTGQQSQIAPALTEFNGQLALAYVANNGSGDLLVALSKDSVNWSSSNPVQGQSSSIGPAITWFNNKLFLAYVANNSTNDLLFATSSDGVHWSGSKPVTGQQSPYTPASTVLGEELYIAYVANNGSNDLIVTKSKDLVHWTTMTVTGQTSPMAPALTAYGGNLVMVYIAENGSLDLIATTSTDGGATWTPGKALASQQTSPMTPALAPFTGNTVVLAYVSNDTSQRLIVSTSSDGINWQPGTNITD
jgi:hypothetical protein